MGSLFNGEYDGTFIPMWMEMVQQSQIEMFEIAAGLGLFFASKDEGELVRMNLVDALSLLLVSDLCLA